MRYKSGHFETPIFYRNAPLVPPSNNDSRVAVDTKRRKLAGVGWGWYYRQASIPNLFVKRIPLRHDLREIRQQRSHHSGETHLHGWTKSIVLSSFFTTPPTRIVTSFPGPFIAGAWERCCRHEIEKIWKRGCVCVLLICLDYSRL